MTHLSNLSIIIPTWQASSALSRLMPDLWTECTGSEIIISDAGSNIDINSLPKGLNAIVLTSPRGRGTQLAAGAAASNRDWFLFLHADSRLPQGFGAAINRHMQHWPEAAAYAALRFDDPDWRASMIARGANLRSSLMALPYGDQGLLIPRALYHDIGGYPAWPLMEDVALIRKLVRSHGRQSLKLMQTSIITSPERYQRDGYLNRSLRNLGCLLAYYRGKSIEQIAAAYQQDSKSRG